MLQSAASSGSSPRPTLTDLDTVSLRKATVSSENYSHRNLFLNELGMCVSGEKSNVIQIMIFQRGLMQTACYKISSDMSFVSVLEVH